MRRPEHEITSLAELSAILDRCPIGRLGLGDQAGIYVVPVNYAHELSGDSIMIYCHGATQGRKHAALQSPGRICFETDHYVAAVPSDNVCHSGTHYESVIGTGTARLITDPVAARAALQLIVERYSPGRGAEVPTELDRVAVFEIHLDEITGKRNFAPN